MIYPKCPTCRTKLSNKELLYRAKLEEICNNDKLTHIEKDKLKKKILDDLELKRYCCRMRMMGSVALVKKIK